MKTKTTKEELVFRETKKAPGQSKTPEQVEGEAGKVGDGAGPGLGGMGQVGLLF